MGYDWGKQLFTSSHRLELLQQLRSDPADTQALTERLSISRVTVQRHLNQCCELGWVRKAEGRYELTPVGEHVCTATTTFLDRLEVLETYETVIDGLGAIDDAFDPLMLADATVSVADANNPHEPIIHYRDAITAATPTSARGILPVFSELLIEVHRELLDEGVESELIAPRSVLEAAPPPIDEIPSEIFTVYVLERSLAFGLTLLDDTALVGIYDEGTFVACIESNEPEFREWLVDVYDTYRETATRVPRRGNGAAGGDPDVVSEPALEAELGSGSDRNTD